MPDPVRVVNRRTMSGTVLPHSRDGRGRALVWLPPPGCCRLACDVEAAEAAGSPLARLLRTTAADFLARWVCTEVEAKLHDVPILAWLRGNGLAPPLAPGATKEVRRPAGARARGEVLYLHIPAIGGHLAFGRLPPPSSAA